MCSRCDADNVGASPAAVQCISLTDSCVACELALRVAVLGIVADGWRFPDLARAFEHADMRVIRQRIEAILKGGGVPSDQAKALGAEVVALALGDAYRRAVLGIAEAGDHMAFARQIEVAAAHGFGRAARSSRSLTPKALRPR